MPLEDLVGPDKFLNALVRENPFDTDDVAEGAPHIRGVKNVTLNSFPNVAGEVSANEVELNRMDGILCSTAELNKLNNLQATTVELDRNSGTLGESLRKHGMYGGRVNPDFPSTGVEVLPPGWSANGVPPGIIVVTHNLGHENYSVIGTAFGGNLEVQYNVALERRNATSFGFAVTIDAGGNSLNFTNANVDFVLIDYS